MDFCLNMSYFCRAIVFALDSGKFIEIDSQLKIALSLVAMKRNSVFRSHSTVIVDFFGE